MNIISGRWKSGKYISAGRAGAAAVIIIDTPSSELLESGYTVKIYDRTGQRIAVMGSDIGDNPIIELEFALLDTGCGEFTLTLGRKPEFDLTYNHRVDIHLFGDSNPWYSGYIIKKPTAGTTENTFTYEGFGYFNQLENTLVNQVYENSEISNIVKNIMTTWIESDTDIRYRASKIIHTGYTANKLLFDYVTGKEAIEQLSEFATNFVFGVDEYRELFFKPIPREINEDSRYWIGWHVHEFTPEEDIESVTNYIYVKAGKLKEDGTNILYQAKDDKSIKDYGLKKAVLQIPSALTETDAQRWGDAKLQELKDPRITAEANNIELFKRKIRAEGKARITTNDGNNIYELPIKKVTYNISSDGVKCAMNLGDVSQTIDNFIINMLRNARNNEIIQQLTNKQLKGVTV